MSLISATNQDLIDQLNDQYKENNTQALNYNTGRASVNIKQLCHVLWEMRKNLSI